jgi:hypothetical protein
LNIVGDPGNTIIYTAVIPMIGLRIPKTAIMKVDLQKIVRQGVDSGKKLLGFPINFVDSVKRSLLIKSIFEDKDKPLPM